MGISQTTLANRTIFCHDNLGILEGINSESVDLIYLDPPFNKNRKFTAPTGSTAKGAEFSDIFREEDVKNEWVKTIEQDNPALYNFLVTTRAMGKNNYTYCYLVYMAIRLIECNRILKDSGSLLLHCDPLMSHYLKIVLDCIFDKSPDCFNNEIVWGYSTSGRAERGNRNSWADKHDIILWYVKDPRLFKGDCTLPVSVEYLASHYKHKDDKGRVCRIRKDAGKERIYYPDEGMNGNDWWEDIPYVNSMAKDRTGYPTQKPIPLLQRLIKAATKKGDFVLDPFCGCATTCVAAETLGREWVGVDISHKAYELVKQRFESELGVFGTKFNYQIEPPERTDGGQDNSLKKYIYVISNEQSPGWYKVGIASDWKKRLGSFQTADPNRGYKKEYALLTPYFDAIEKKIHEDFENRHEWIKAELKDIKKAIEKYHKKGHTGGLL